MCLNKYNNGNGNMIFFFNLIKKGSNQILKKRYLTV